MTSLEERATLMACEIWCLGSTKYIEIDPVLWSAVKATILKLLQEIEALNGKSTSS